MPSVVVLGAALLDLHARSRARIIPGTSNPGRVHTTAGGVGRNIAESIARLGTQVALVALIGPDEAGDRVLRDTSAAGVDVSLVMTGPEPTGSYLAVLDDDGELAVALSDLTGTERVSVAAFQASEPAIAQAAVVVVDANLPVTVVSWALRVAHLHGVRVVLDPVSVPKARPLAAVLAEGLPVYAVTPNADELPALTGGAADPVGWLLDHGVDHVWVRRGAQGSTLHSRAGALHVPAAPVTVADVTGAGDSMTAGFVHALVTGGTPAQATTYGQVVAELTVSHPATVRPDLTDALVRARLKETR
ncbi:MAG: carbohydrate kinase family protein [Tetrasphaera sp.]|nr:carbohydrate kinase family protein [Tetrasphaera sp.]